MKYFRLPDLGEGLQEAEIVQWHVDVGARVEVDQLLVSVETAKAIVDLPSPQSGEVAARFGEPGDLIHVGEPLLEFAGEQQADAGTVVGDVSAGAAAVSDDHFIIGSAHRRTQGAQLATPAIRALAARLQVDLSAVTGTGRAGVIRADDVEKAARLQADHGDAVPLRGVRRAMAQNMARSHAEVVSVTLYEDVDIHAWSAHTDVTMRLVRALAAACRAEPHLNAWFDSGAMTLRDISQVDLGIAVDTADGLFVPVLRNIAAREPDDLRAGLQRLRADVRARTIPPAEMTGATLTLSNFGTIAGRYGNPVIVPPQVAILGAGVIRDEVRAVAGVPVVRPVMPLSLSFDHRVVTGGEAARFLKALMADLAQA